MELVRFENSSVYPIDKEAIDSIAANMRENGYDGRFPILVVDGDKIVDGYHRYEAAKIAGVEPVVEEFVGTEKEIYELVIRSNGDRRHLLGGQKAAALLLLNRRLGRDAKNIKEVMDSAGVKESTINRLSSLSDDDLAGIASGEETQADVQKKRSGRKKSIPTTYTLTKTQVGTCGMISNVSGDSTKKIIAHAFATGLAALDDEARLTMASK